MLEIKNLLTLIGKKQDLTLPISEPQAYLAGLENLTRKDSNDSNLLLGDKYGPIAVSWRRGERTQLGVVAQAFNSSTQEEEAGGCLSSRPAWSNCEFQISQGYIVRHCFKDGDSRLAHMCISQHPKPTFLVLKERNTSAQKENTFFPRTTRNSKDLLRIPQACPVVVGCYK